MVAPGRVAGLIGLVALSFNIIGLSALPTINSVSPPSKPQEITGKVDGNGITQSNEKDTASAAIAINNFLAGATSLEGKINNAEKLKRGLTNFMNHLNPAPYFVPPPKVKSTPVKAQAEPATIVNDGTSAAVVIKGPNRLVQARQLGGPLRWGRR